MNNEGKNIAIKRLVAIFICLAFIGFIWWLGTIGVSLMWRAIIAVVILIVLAVSRIMLSNGRRMRVAEGRKKISHILYEDGNADEFIFQTKKLLEKTEDRSLIGALKVDLAMAYMFKGNFEEAWDIFKLISIEGMDSINNNIYMLNKILLQFFTGDHQTAIKIMDVNKEVFDELKDSKRYAYLEAPMSMIACFRQKKLGNKACYEELISQARLKWDDCYNKTIFNHIENA